ncbi:MAG: ATP-binding cassette domain-containing protein [Oscillibacter sp.]|nr:ATP-binding cassette domain-containing protein [Oscillibacter sp.]
MAETVLTVSGLKKYFPITVSGRGLYREKRVLKALDGVSFTIRKGETLGLVGESGCGKSTLAKIIMRLLPVTDGQIVYGDTDVTRLSTKQLRPLRRRVQMIFQDPYASLNPRETVRELLAAPLESMELGEPRERTVKIHKALDSIGLDTSFLEKYPHEMSGGQRQRIAVARAMISKPDLVVCDEPVSALDVSVRGQILNLMKRLQREQGLSYLFISHDFGNVRYLCDRVAVMYLGRIVEEGTKQDIFDRAVHPYTKALLSANPVPDIRQQGKRVMLRGDTAGAVYIPSGCAFRTRCPHATEGCSKGGGRLLTPLKRADGDTHSSACPRYPAL